MSNTETVNEALLAWRKRRKLDRAQAAEVLQIPARTIEMIEYGRTPTWPNLLLAHLQLLDERDRLARRLKRATTLVI